MPQIEKCDRLGEAKVIMGQVRQKSRAPRTICDAIVLIRQIFGIIVSKPGSVGAVEVNPGLKINGAHKRLHT